MTELKNDSNKSISNDFLKSLSDEELWTQTLKEAEVERNSTLKMIAFIQEISCRHLHLKRGFSSLHEYCVQVLKYTDGSAYRRIKAMTLIEDLPETRSSIESGTLSLTTASQIQQVIEKKKKSNKPLAQNEKLDLFQKLDGKSKKEIEKTIAEICPEVIMKTERQRFVGNDRIQKTLVMSERLHEKIEKLKKLRAHEGKDFLAILEELIDRELKRVDPMAKSSACGTRNFHIEKAEKTFQEKKTTQTISRNQSELTIQNELAVQSELTAQSELTIQSQLTIQKEAASPEKPAEKNIETKITRIALDKLPKIYSRYIPARTKQEVWQRSNGQCSYVDPLTDRKCNSTHFLQVDHIIPFAKGGATIGTNLRLLCANHNKLEAMRHFGQKVFVRQTE